MAALSLLLLAASLACGLGNGWELPHDVSGVAVPRALDTVARICPPLIFLLLIRGKKQSPATLTIRQQLVGFGILGAVIVVLALPDRLGPA